MLGLSWEVYRVRLVDCDGLEHEREVLARSPNEAIAMAETESFYTMDAISAIETGELLIDERVQRIQ